MRFFHWGESTLIFFVWVATVWMSATSLSLFSANRPSFYSESKNKPFQIQFHHSDVSSRKPSFQTGKKIITFLLIIKLFSWGSNIQSLPQSEIFCKQQQLKFSCGRKQSLTLGGAVDEWSKALNLREKIKKKKTNISGLPQGTCVVSFLKRDLCYA